MKHLSFIIILVFFASKIYSQAEVPSSKEIALFKKTTTYIVLDDSPFMTYNFKIKDAVKNSWKVTPYEFISTSQFEDKRKDKKCSFISLDEVWFSKDKLKAQYNFLCLSLGGNYKNAKDMPQLCNVPVSYLGVEEDSYTYKLSALLQIIQDHISFVENTPGLSDINVKKKINDNAYKIKNKILYVIKDELSKSINTESKFSKIYPYKFKFVTRGILEKAIDGKEKGIVFLHKVGPEGTERKARCYKTIIGTENSKMYYFDYHMISSKKPDGLLEKDLKKIANAKQ